MEKHEVLGILNHEAIEERKDVLEITGELME